MALWTQVPWRRPCRHWPRNDASEPRFASSEASEDRFIAGVGRQTPLDRYWDKASTKDAGAFTAGVLLHKLKDGRFCIAHCRRGQWAALQREREIKQVAELDGKRVPIGIEQEPGSGGKESAETTIRNLAGWRITADRPTGDKVVRAEPYAAQVQGGNVLLVKGAWNKDFIDEHVSFPVGRAKDQVDAAAAAFNLLALKKNRAPVAVEMTGLLG